MLSLTKEIARRGFGNFLNDFMLPNPDNIVRTKGGYDTLRRLRNDPHLSSTIQSRKSGLLSMDWHLKAYGANKKITDEIESMLDSIALYDFMRDILEAPLFGFQPIEIIWEEKSGKYLPSKLIAKPQEWFYFDSTGKIKLRNSNDIAGADIPENKFIIVRHEPTYLNPYGNSLLSKCYWSVTFKNAALRFWVNFMERYGMPLLLGQYTRGATSDEARRLADELSNMSEDSVIVTPSDINIEMKEPMRFSSNSLYKDLIKHSNDEISKAILSETLTTEMQGGSYAASKIHYKVRREVVLTDKNLVEWAVNQLIKAYVEVNFKGEIAPIFGIILKESEQSEIIKRDEVLAKYCGVKFTKEYFISRYGFSPEEIDI